MLHSHLGMLSTEIEFSRSSESIAMHVLVTSKCEFCNLYSKVRNAFLVKNFFVPKYNVEVSYRGTHKKLTWNKGTVPN